MVLSGYFSKRNHQLLVFSVLAFLVAWSVWLPLIASIQGLNSIRFPTLFYWVAGIAPIGSATLVEWIYHGKQGVQQLYSRFRIQGVPLRWYCAAALLPVCICFVQILVTGGAISSTTIILAILALGKGVLLAPIAAFEEVGWRGFALPRLQKWHNALVSSLILGLIWAIWHLPLFWIGLFYYSDMNLGWWTVDVLAVSVLVTWLFNNGRGSLWTSCLFHATANMSYATLTHIQGEPPVSIVCVLFALVVTLVYKPTNLSRTQPRQTEI